MAASRARRTRTDGATSARLELVLRLYVTGSTPNSVRAIQSIKHICETCIEGRYDLEVIDIYQHPSLAKDEQIIATPTLVRHLPLPLRRFIGDLSNADKILFGMDLRPAKVPHRE